MMSFPDKSGYAYSGFVGYKALTPMESPTLMGNDFDIVPMLVKTPTSATKKQVDCKSQDDNSVMCAYPWCRFDNF